jgi:hypothetical protein
VQFGVSGMDRRAIIVNVSDAQQALDITNLTSPLFILFDNCVIDEAKYKEEVRKFRERKLN